ESEETESEFEVEPTPPLTDDRMLFPEEEWDNQEGRNNSSGERFQAIDLLELFTKKNIIISIAVTLLVILIYRQKELLLHYYFLAVYRMIGSDERFQNAYERLLWILEKEGFPRKESETL